MIDFLNDPAKAPEDACLAGLRDWKFVVPAALGKVEWVPFTNKTMAIQGLAPYGWTEAQIGVYGRGTSATDVTALLMQSMAGTAQDLLDLLTQQLGLAEAPKVAGQREANGLTWSLYAVEVQGLQIDFALSEGKELGYVILLQSSAKERDALYDLVYLPAIDALEPIQQVASVVGQRRPGSRLCWMEPIR